MDDGVRDGTNMVDDDGDGVSLDRRALAGLDSGDGLTLSQRILLERIAELERVNEAMHSDWHKLNTFLNMTAINFSWCSEYEERLRHYNGEFELLKLSGRHELPRTGCLYCGPREYGRCVNREMTAAHVALTAARDAQAARLGIRP